MTGDRLGLTPDLVRDDQVAGPEFVAESTGHAGDQHRLLTGLLQAAARRASGAYDVGREPVAEGEPLGPQRCTDDSGHPVLRAT